MLSPAEYRYILTNDLATFIERSFRELNPAATFTLSRHIEVLARKLEDCRLGRIKRLIINLPPRSLKSICASVAFPAWLLGHDPTAQIICASYGHDLAEKHARDCRRLMMAGWYKGAFSRTRLPLRQPVNDITTTLQGVRMATSVGGVLTGRGAMFIIIDDPQKPDEALSSAGRNAVKEWYDNSLLSRLNSKTEGCIIIVMQRLHQDDLVGHVLEQAGWEVVSFPAIAVEDETHIVDGPLGRRVFSRRAGEALDPEREPLSALEEIRRSIGSYNFSAQYQQAPIPVGGAIVQTSWLRSYRPEDKPPSFTRVIQSWDTANKATELNNFSVCTTWGVVGRKRYLLDVYRARLNFPDLKRKVKELASRYQPQKILVEDRASGTQLIQELTGAVFGITPYVPPSGTDKVMRLHAQTATFEAGSVLLPERAPWLDVYIAELTGFPGSKYDDQVDSTTQALDYLGPGTNSMEIWERLAG
jgi:predicted phage terminase large subunit-like protein